MTDWVQDYLGVPFVPKGRSGEGLDCAGLVVDIYQRVLGIKLPDMVGDLNYSAVDPRYAEEQFKKGLRSFTLVEKPHPLGLVVMSRFGLAAHVGVAIDERDFIHTTQLTGCVVERLSDPLWVPRIRGFYRYDGPDG